MSSSRFKPVKRTGMPMSRRGGAHARMVRYAQRIESQEQMNKIIAEATAANGPELVADWLLAVKPYLKFEPAKFQAVEVPQR